MPGTLVEAGAIVVADTTMADVKAVKKEKKKKGKTKKKEKRRRVEGEDGTDIESAGKKKKKKSKDKTLKKKKDKTLKKKKDKTLKKEEQDDIVANVDGKEDGKEVKKTKKSKKKKKSKSVGDIAEGTETQTVNDKVSAPGSSPAVSSFTAAEAAAYRKKRMMSVSEESPDFRPLKNFSESGFPESLLKCCASFSSPTPIQSQVWPILAKNRDCVAIAETGSGKTLGFGLPLLQKVMSMPSLGKKVSSRGPYGLVIAPTRELAIQSYEVLKDAGASAGLKVTCIYGGGDRREQVQAIKGGVHVIVATPGRLLSLVNDRIVSLKKVQFVVLDEADRMLDMGFVPDVRSLVSHCADNHHTMMFSATWPEEVGKVGSEFLKNPVRVLIGSDELTANANVKQSVEVLAPFHRDRRVDELLRKYHDGKNLIIVFVLYKKEACRVEGLLRRRGWNCVAIHGDKSQGERLEALSSFRNGSVPILVATDVAARGLDIPNVEVVLNYSFPLTIEDYVHRIGRTGRAGRNGLAHTMFTELDKSLAGALVNVLNEAKADVPQSLLKFGTAVKRKQHSMYGDHFRRDDRPVKEAQHVKF